MKRHPLPSLRPSLEALEDRCLLSSSSPLDPTPFVNGPAQTGLLLTGPITGPTAIPPLTPMYLGDTAPINLQFVTMQVALNNLLTAESQVYTALFTGSLPQTQQAFGNLVTAMGQYKEAVLLYDLTLPSG